MKQRRPVGDSLERELSRRGFLAGAGGVLSLAGLLRLLGSLDPEAVFAAAPPSARAAGADVVRATMAALADTIVPGPAGGADPDPGAIEAGVVEEIYDDFYGASGLFPAVHADLQVATPLVIGRPAAFDLELPYPDRERVVLDRVQGGSPLGIAYVAVGTLIWVTYYGVASSNAGMRYLRFPPHSDGYWPDHSYRVRFRGMTEDGNPR